MAHQRIAVDAALYLRPLLLSDISEVRRRYLGAFDIRIASSPYVRQTNPGQCGPCAAGKPSVCFHAVLTRSLAYAYW